MAHVRSVRLAGRETCKQSQAGSKKLVHNRWLSELCRDLIIRAIAAFKTVPGGFCGLSIRAGSSVRHGHSLDTGTCTVLCCLELGLAFG
jgi:hypothetical protein